MALNCARTACQLPLDDRDHCAIWNDFSTRTPRLYCVPCARKILEANLFDVLKLEYEWRRACDHERLNEEGACRACGADCRGIG